MSDTSSVVPPLFNQLPGGRECKPERRSATFDEFSSAYAFKTLHPDWSVNYIMELLIQIDEEFSPEWVEALLQETNHER
jgi:hypothetical protein